MADSNDIEVKDGQKYVDYPPASDACNSLGSTVPIGFAREQLFFNNDLKTVLFDVDEFVKNRLQYKSIDALCAAFAKEQIDAIATAIFNWERNGNAIIVSDQTGLGKGRIIAGLIRYSILHLDKVPIFFTEKRNLFSDIYRDLYDVGFDAGVPIKVKTEIVQYNEEDLTDSFIIKAIKRDLKNDDELRIEWTMPNDDSYDKLFTDQYEDELEEVIELYRQHILENGIEEGSGVKKVSERDLEKAYLEASKEGRIKVTPYAPFALKIKNRKGNILYDISASEAKKGIEDGELHTKYRLILMLYTTLQRGIFENDVLTKKGILLNRLAEDNVIIMDESHNAAGDSLRSEVLISMLRSAKYASYVSATWAKRPSNLPLYSVRTSIRETYLSPQQIVMAFNSGGLALQEAVSSKLVSTGQLIRRDKPLDGETFYYEEDDQSQIGQQQIDKLNRITEMWDKITKFSTNVRKSLRESVRRKYPEDDQKDERNAYKYKGKVNRLTFQLFNYFLLGLKVRQCAEEAISQLRDGKKVVITIANTLESAFTNLKQNYEQDIPYEIGDRIRNDFSLILEYLLFYTMNVGADIQRVTDRGATETESLKTNLIKRDWESVFDGIRIGRWSVNDVFEDVRSAMNDEYENVSNGIFTIGLSISPIDVIKTLISAEGYSVDEITGRTKMLTFEQDEDGRFDFEYGILTKRAKTDRQDIVNAFNSNELDCVIINQSGSTGLSLHAIQTIDQGKVVPPVNEPALGETRPIPMSLEPRNEVKQRCMLILQMELNVATEIQKLGRVNRNGQIYPPIYKYIISAIPSESRLSAMMQRKLKSLMASTTGEQEFGKDIFNLDDFFSDYAVLPWNDTCQQLYLDSDVYGVANADDIYNKTKLFYFMSYTMQRNFYNIFSEKLRAHIADLEEKGQYFAKIQYKDYKATTESVIPFIIGDNNATSDFANHTYAELAECTIYDSKNTESDIATSILDKLYIYDFESYDKKTYGNVDSFAEKAIAQAQYVADRYIKMKADDNADALKTQEVYENMKEAAEAEAAKIPIVEKVIELEEEIEKKITEQELLNKQILKSYEDGVEDKTLAPQALQLGKQIKTLKESLSKLLGNDFVNSKEVSAKLREIERTIRNADNEISSYQQRIETNKLAIEKEQRTKDMYVSFVRGIGKVYNYKNFEEVIAYDEQFNENYTYNLNIDSDCVLVGVKFDFNNEFHFTPSAIHLFVLTVTGAYEISVSQLYPSLSQTKIDMGAKPKEYLEPKDIEYKGYWDMYIKEIDTGYRKQKVFLSGNLLRGIAFNYLINLGGNITKYSTNNNKLQISLELNEASANQIMPKFNEGTNYSLLFGLSQDNIERLVPQMLATAVYYDRDTIAIQLMYDATNIFMLATLTMNVWQSLSAYKDINYVEEEEFVQYAMPIIKSDFQQNVIFTLTSQRYEAILAFDNICVGKGSEPEIMSEDVFSSSQKRHFLFQLEEATKPQSQGRGRRKTQNIDITWSSPIETLAAHPLKTFVKGNSNVAMNKIDYVISTEVLDDIQTAKSNERWFKPLYNLSMSAPTLYEVIEYLKASFIQLVGVTSSDSLNVAEPKFVFDIASTTRGLIDDTGIVQIQGVGNDKYQPIENIVAEFLAYYKSN